MVAIDYVDIPQTAVRLQSSTPSATRNPRPAMKVVTSLPQSEKAPRSASGSTPTQVQSPNKSGFSFQQVLLSSTLQLPANVPTAPRGATKLLSTRDPLSIPIMTVNFRRFVAKVGPVFWLQDRMEEIVMWRKGWKYTAVWMCAYAFLCYYPRLCLLIPVAALLGVLLATHPSLARAAPPKIVLPPPGQGPDWSLDWLGNVQAIQNLMGAFSDTYDFGYPVVPHLSHSSPYTPIIFTFAGILLLVSIPLVHLLPLRTAFLILGLTPFLLTHPFVRYTILPVLLDGAAPYLIPLRVRWTRLVDNDRLEDKHWRSELRTVELWENERWLTPGGDEGASGDAGWGKAHLRPGERRAWTRGRDGWSGVADGGSGDVSSNLTFSLSPGWLFVETEDWRPDLEGTWLGREHTGDNGWVYTDDVWMHPCAVPQEAWKAASGMTRRRRWVRRIYYDPAAAAS
ncbi:hypothetical protein PHLGIDRAFT_117085 [Phlebiopsis gigantea 11061_1 CR5-6]|uniref:TECPR1-like DysF domain-containing protein n=1 Tax=Phlebiopsis gigantea (strain 11061_1 CR5-6) TaxID=745531 RepID=A0A0C3NTJ7_PHLG1|nr:hypothetical protein PHLGIDRAFT_117085 [Phlebiopsis gigantea 11061_1 CR5-6]